MTIFPNSNFPSDIIQRIAFFCNASSLIKLSGTQKTAYQVLSNDPFFKELFESKYPYLKPYYEGMCTHLRLYHPKSCYKVICAEMDSPSLGRYINGSTLSPSFSEEALSKILFSLVSRKQELEKSLQELPIAIRIAKNKYKQSEQEFNALLAEYHRACEQKHDKLLSIIEPIKDILSDSKPEFNEVVRDFLANEEEWNRFLLIPDEEFLEMEKIENEDRSPIFKDIARFFIQLREDYEEAESKLKKLNQLEDTYVNLKDDRGKYEGELKQITTQLDPEFQDRLIYDHESNLSKELGRVFHLHQSILGLSQLDASVLYVQHLIDHFDENTPGDFQFLRRMIDALPKDRMKSLKMIGTAESYQRLRDKHAQLEAEIFEYSASDEFFKKMQQQMKRYSEVADAHYEAEYPLNKLEALQPEQIKYYLIRLVERLSHFAFDDRKRIEDEHFRLTLGNSISKTKND